MGIDGDELGRGGGGGAVVNALMGGTRHGGRTCVAGVWMGLIAGGGGAWLQGINFAKLLEI
jgi:hypothetical protein